METTPVFSSHYSLSRSILTLEKAGKSNPTGPNSIIDLAIQYKLPRVVLVEDNMAGDMEAYSNFKEAKIPLIFGLRLKFCADVADKSEESLNTEHNLILLIKNFSGYERLLKISSRAATDNFYYVPRMDFKTMKPFWSDKDLQLVVPFYSSFLAQNALTFNSCVPDFSYAKPVFFEEDNNLPIDSIISRRVKDYAGGNFETLKTKSVYYHKRDDFLSLAVLRCIAKRTKLSKPNLEGFSSNEFCLEALL